MSKARDLANAADVLDDVSATELSYVNGVTSAIQTQLNAKQAVVSGVNDTEIGYLDGVTSAIQTQLDAKTAKSILTTTGDIYYASSANTPARLGIGSTGNVLTVSGGIPAWAAPAGGGKVLQVVNATYSTTTTIASTTKTDTGLSASITPTANTSKILVLVSQHIWVNNDTERVQGGGVYLLRGSTEIWNGSDQLSWHNFGSGFMQYGALWTLHYYDSPATTSSTTYKTQGDSWTTNYNSNIKFQQNSVTSSMTLLEIGA